MEFFAKAHVVCSNAASSNIKSKKNVKKQLKQMLHGYKESNINLIKSSAVDKTGYDSNSTSVSGYSDLNLTDSDEEHLPQKVQRNLAVDENKDLFDNSDINTAQKDTPKKSLENIVSKDNVSITEESNDIYSLEESEVSSVSGLFKSESDTNSSEPFDADGLLAAKILKRLQITNIKNQSLKRKHENVSNEDIPKAGKCKTKSVKRQEMQPPISEEEEQFFDSDLEKCNIAKVSKGKTKPVKQQEMQPVVSEEDGQFSDNKSKKPNIPKAGKSKPKSLKKQPIEEAKEFSDNNSKKSNIEKVRKEKTKSVKRQEMQEDKQFSDNDSKKQNKPKAGKSKTISLKMQKLQLAMSEEDEQFSDNNSEEHNIPKVGKNKAKSIVMQEIESAISEEDEQFSDSNSSCGYAMAKDYSAFSPPYVSISAEGVPLLSFNDVLGGYKHTTIKNVPSKQNLVTEKDYFNFIVDKCMSVDKTEAEIGSLTPEPSSDNDIGDIEEIINLDSTTETQETDTPILPNIPLDDTIQSELLSENEMSTDEDYYRVIDTFKIYYGHKCCVIILKHPTELFIQGKVSIRIFDGSIDIFGYTPKDDTCKLYAPFYSYAQSIRTIEKPNDYYGLFGKLTEAGLSVLEAEEIVITIGEHDGVILLKPLENQCLDFVDNNFKITNLFARSVKNVEPFFSKATNILNCSLFSIRPARCFKVHPSWKEAVKYSEEKSSRGIICGGKGSGKSTYLRYQVNKLISEGPVLVVDLDPGQSEFTVAGGISATTVTEPLLGPSFTHLKKPDIMFNVGMINTMDNARRYVAALHQLLSHCNNHKAYSEMPWIVNTMGMTNFLGLKFITLIITLTQPTYLLQYESRNAKRRFDTFLRPSNIKLLLQEYESDPLFSNITIPENLNYKFVVADEADNSLKNGYALAPRDERLLNFLSYFGQLLTINRVKSLLAITPYKVNLNDVNIVTNVIVKKECITKVINGQVVALCQLLRQCDSKVFTLDDRPLICYGHGIVRGIDWEKEVLYLITPLEGNFLACVDTLLYTDWSPDPVGQETSLPNGTSVPYHIFTRMKQIQLMSTPRRRFNPLQLIKMSRNNASIESSIN